MIAEWAPSAASRRRVPLTAVHGACQTRPSPSPPFCFVSNGLPPGLAEGVDQVVLWVESFLPVARAISRLCCPGRRVAQGLLVVLAGVWREDRIACIPHSGA